MTKLEAFLMYVALIAGGASFFSIGMSVAEDRVYRNCSDHNEAIFNKGTIACYPTSKD